MAVDRPGTVLPRFKANLPIFTNVYIYVPQKPVCFLLHSLLGLNHCKVKVCPLYFVGCKIWKGYLEASEGQTGPPPSLPVLIRLVNLALSERRASTEELPRSDWPVGTAVEDCLDYNS